MDLVPYNLTHPVGTTVGTMPKLSALKVKSLLKTPGRHADGDGLYFYVKPTGTASWVFRTTVKHHRTDFGLGPYPKVSAAMARVRAREIRAAIDDGRNPLEPDEPDEPVPTFAEAAVAYYNKHRKGWKTERYARGWISQLNRFALPLIGHIPIGDIDQKGVLKVLEPIWTTKHETAKKVRQHLSQIFEDAKARKWATTNPAGDVIDGALPQARHTTINQKALHYDQVAGALAIIDNTGAFPTSKLCIRFLALTAARSGEARGATWSEIFNNQREWRIPPARMKTAKLHRIPLSQAAMDVLGEAMQMRDTTELVFPSAQGKVISDSTLSKLFRENNIPAVPHGFRSSFRDWGSNELRADSDALELCLAHVVGSKTKRAYFRSDLFNERREIMDAWGEYLTQ